MMKVYVNYPEPKFRIHRNPSCAEIYKMKKPGQRHIRIDIDTVSAELWRFANKEHTFNSNESNDMWLDIEFDDADFEISVLKYVHRLIGKYYAPLGRIKPDIHC